MTIDGAPPTPWAAPPGRPPSRRATWLLVATAAWALLLVVLASVSTRDDAPTVREQRSIADAQPVVSRVTGELVTAAGTDVVTEVAEERLVEGCRITPMRDGATLDRDITVYTTQSAAPALLDRIAQHLPNSYNARVRHSTDGARHSLRADAGEFIAIRGELTGPGVVTLTVTTGCRPAGVTAPS